MDTLIYRDDLLSVAKKFPSGALEVRALVGKGYNAWYASVVFYDYSIVAAVERFGEQHGLSVTKSISRIYDQLGESAAWDPDSDYDDE